MKFFYSTLIALFATAAFAQESAPAPAPEAAPEAAVAAPTPESAPLAEPTFKMTAAPEVVEEALTWDDNVTRQFSELPLQEGGRVKPLDTFAQFTLLRINGKRDFKTPNGRKLNPTQWLMDCLFYPEVARDYQHFTVDNSEVVTSIGVTAHSNIRSRYSYNELVSGRQKLFTLAQEYSEKEAKDRSAVEQQIINLAQNVFSFEQLAHFFDFARFNYAAPPDTALAAVFKDPNGVTFTEALRLMPATMMTLQQEGAGLSPERMEAERKAVESVLGQIQRLTDMAFGLSLVPPKAATEPKYMTPMETMMSVFQSEGASSEDFTLLSQLETMARNRAQYLQTVAQAKPDAALNTDFISNLTNFRGTVVSRAVARGEYDKVPLEAFYYRVYPIYWCLVLFALSFLLVALMWLMPHNKWMVRATTISVVVPTFLLIATITLRCIIRGRPPVSTLYETIIFITAVAVVVALFIEYANRRRIALSIGGILGVLGMFLAYRYEIHEGVDTMPALQAVLDTNFWLATHVTIINIGYAAGMLAGALAHVYILGRLFWKHTPNREFFRGLSRMTYGVVSFGLLFSAVGTVLGGIWANDSWGRFWGWDPKENGALMIVLWSLVILHARMGGYVREIGIAVTSVILGMIVAFSWFGVNLLGVGLHAYGFTSGIWEALTIFWVIEGIVAALGVVVWILEPMREKGATTPEKPGKLTAQASES